MPTILRRPAWACALAALVVRVLLVLHAWDTNPFVREPDLDGALYLRWAREIADGDLLGEGGVAGGRPWLFNPLYAYVLAAFHAVLDAPLRLILLAQAALGAATAGLAAGAATRTSGRAAGWVAGLLVVFSAPLAQLDAHVSIAELAAFLVAGACFATSPPTAGDRRAAHGPVAAGVWLGVAAVARPVTAFAVPLVAWGFARRSERPVRSAIVCVAAFAACAVPSLARNWAIGGEPVVWTGSGAINAALANNAAARAGRTMASPWPWLHFNPVEMHGDARRHVASSLGREPTDTEVSAWFRDALLADAAEEPGATVDFLAHKARWFAGPREVPSSASLATDRAFSPHLALAFVPTWLVAALAVAGLWACRRRADVLLGPGAVLAAHVAVLTAVFPLSHYRAPAIPAMAVFAGAAVAACLHAGSGRVRLALAGVAAATAIVGALPPQPDPMRARDEIVLANRAAARGELDAAERHARAAIDALRDEHGPDAESAATWQTLGETLYRRGRYADARAAFDGSVRLAPDDLAARVHRSATCEMLGDLGAAEADARAAVAAHPHSGFAHARLGEVLSRTPSRADEARAALQRAIELGVPPSAVALRRVGAQEPR